VIRLIGWTSDANGRYASSRVFSAKSVCPDKCSRARAPRLIAAAPLPVNPLFCNREAVHSRCPDDCVLQIFRFWLAAVRSSVVLRRDALSHRDKAQQISLTSISVLLLKDHSQVSDTESYSAVPHLRVSCLHLPRFRSIVSWLPSDYQLLH
jgi:hypothetical protein